MAKWLSQAWLDESTRLAADQPVRPGVSARLQYVITGGPEGDVAYYWVIVDGQLVENRLGMLEDAEVTLTESYEDALRMQKGELDANAAFLQGKVAVTGDVAKLLSLLPITMSPEFKEFQDRVLEITEF
jgi:putative sterol carrier protein